MTASDPLVPILLAASSGEIDQAVTGLRREAESLSWPHSSLAFLAAATDAVPLARHFAPRVLTPSSLATAGFSALVGKHHWTAVTTGDRAERLQSVWLARDLADSAAYGAAVRIDADATTRPPLLFDLWTHFTHPRQRFGARLDASRDGLTAEIALAVHPSLIVLEAQIGARTILAMTTDQIAAELIGLALWQGTLDPAAAPIGPWEDPLIQRATELDLGLRWPGPLRLFTVPTDAIDHEWLDDLRRRVADRLGMNSSN